MDSTSPRISRSLISVSDKSDLLPLAQGLAAAGIEIYSTGGTRRFLEEAQLAVHDVAQYTGFPEILDGRVKTLHPRIAGGVLCRHDRPDDMAALDEHGILPLELVVVNLYPFEQTVARADVTFEEAVEQIDIGGPTLVRAAAKNHRFVTIVTDASQYAEVLDEISSQGMTSHSLRRRLAQAAFQRTTEYDAAIATYLAGQSADAETASADTGLPDRIAISMNRKAILRYGENPHQAAALYADRDAAANTLVGGKQLHGKELSYNNLLDLDSALALARGLPQPSAAVLKHNNPCGAATASSLAEATRKAWEGDPQSAFGSVLGMNVPVDAATAEVLAEPGKFVEAILAPAFEPAAVEVLTQKPSWKANVRLIEVQSARAGGGQLAWRQIDGGMLCQQRDDQADDVSSWEVVTDEQPSPALQEELAFAWAVCRHVKSNAIVLAREQMLVGVGAGQMSRVDAVDIAIRKAGARAAGAVLASDAFFPFDDSIHSAAKAGIAAVVQPGGSRRDEEVVAAANQHGLPMIFTGRRHFRH